MTDSNTPVQKTGKNTLRSEVSAVHKLAALIDQLTPEQQLELDRVGVRIPGGDLTAAMEGRYKYGVRCTQCNKVALMFVGDKWRDPEGGERTLPPLYLHHSRVAWTQDLPTEKINRNAPTCQSCGHPVALNQDGSFRSDRGRIIIIQDYIDGRDKVYSKKYLDDFRKKVAEGDGPAVEVSSDYTQKDRPVSEVIREQRGSGALQELEHIAQATGVAKAVATGRMPG